MSTSSTSIALRRADLPRLSLTVKAAATVLAIVAAVALPQLFHVIGAVSGQGTMLGVAFLPMHLPIIFVGLIAGPAVGAIAGAAAPLVSFLLSGMPMLAMLPLMMIELCAYGLIAGLLRSVKLPSLVKVVLAQLAGRVVLTVATAIAVFVFGSSDSIAATWTSESWKKVVSNRDTGSPYRRMEKIAVNHNVDYSTIREETDTYVSAVC